MDLIYLMDDANAVDLRIQGPQVFTPMVDFGSSNRESDSDHHAQKITMESRYEPINSKPYKRKSHNAKPKNLHGHLRHWRPGCHSHCSR